MRSKKILLIFLYKKLKKRVYMKSINPMRHKNGNRSL